MPATSDAQSFRWGTQIPSALYRGTTKVWPIGPTTLMTEDFSSGNWDAWTNNAAFGGTVAVTSGVGQMVLTTNSNWADAGGVTRYRTLSAADFDLTFDFVKDTAWACSIGVGLRMTGNTVGSGITMWINPDNTWQLEENGANLVAPISFPQTAGTWYRVRARAVGAQVTARYWTVGSGEPSTWSMSTTSAVKTAAGYLGFCHVGQATGTRTIGLDNITVTTP